MNGYEKYKAEEQRQATALAKAMKKAADECTKSFTEAPMLNALLGALVGLEIGALSAIESGKTRKAMIATMAKQRDIGILDEIYKAGHKFSEVAILGGRN